MTVQGPFNSEDWLTMKALREDLAFTREHLTHKPDFQIVERYVANQYKGYTNRQVA
jgi:hypothetical protein